MQYSQYLETLPVDIMQDWRARLSKGTATQYGCFRLVNVRRTKPKTFEEQRVVVLVLDQNELPMSNINVAFSYDTADIIDLLPNMVHVPRGDLMRAFVVPTGGSGQIDQIQGSAVKPGQPGGISAWVYHPLFSSDVVDGAGMLGDHTGLHLTFKLQRTDGVRTYDEMFQDIYERIKNLEDVV